MVSLDRGGNRPKYRPMNNLIRSGHSTLHPVNIIIISKKGVQTKVFVNGHPARFVVNPVGQKDQMIMLY